MGLASQVRCIDRRDHDPGSWHRRASAEDVDGTSYTLIRARAKCSPLLLGTAVLLACMPSAQCYRQQVNVSVNVFLGRPAPALRAICCMVSRVVAAWCTMQGSPPDRRICRGPDRRCR